MTPISNIIDLVNTLKNNDTITVDPDTLMNYIKVGLLQTNVALSKNYSIIDADNIDGDMSSNEIYLCALYSYRNMLNAEYMDLTRKAVSFRTLNFAVEGLIGRANEFRRAVQRYDDEISKLVDALRAPIGGASEMKGDNYNESV